VTFSALDSDLFGDLFATHAMRAVFSDHARLAAMLQAEAALARAEARFGLVPDGLALAIHAIGPEDLDREKLGEGTALAGVPTIPFVKAVQALLPRELEPFFHRGATSQDIFDTALVLQIGQALALLETDMAATIAGLAALAQKHRKTPCIGRSYGQHAAPVTFGYKAAIWATGIAEMAARLPELRSRALSASLGGPVGTLAALGEKGPAVAEAFAAELGLAAAPIAWHTSRARIAETGAWLALLIGALAKMATDVAHLASTEVGEVAEPHAAGRGGSSAMPHKQNPVSATIIQAAHGAAPGHLATLVSAMAAQHERPAGAWHAEWHALPQLFGLASGALREGRRLAEGLLVDEPRMLSNLSITRGLIFADGAAAGLAEHLGRQAAHALLERAAEVVRATGQPLAEVLRNDAAIPPEAKSRLDAAFDLQPAIEAAALWTDRALAALPSPETGASKPREDRGS
jgi:3-carboxy-cis,cis-muconate cycloisomerase